MPSTPEIRQTKARHVELNLSLPCEWQGFNSLEPLPAAFKVWDLELGIQCSSQISGMDLITIITESQGFHWQEAVVIKNPGTQLWNAGVLTMRLNPHSLRDSFWVESLGLSQRPSHYLQTKIVLFLLSQYISFIFISSLTVLARNSSVILKGSDETECLCLVPK